MADLRERLEMLDGPSALIDAEIYATLDGAPRTTTAGGRTIPLVEGGDPKAWPAYTASLDAAVALVERMLPGWGWTVNSSPLTATVWTPEGTASTATYQVAGSTPAIAICLALLRAIEER